MSWGTWDRLRLRIRRGMQWRPLAAPPAGGEFDTASLAAIAALVSLGTLLVFSTTALGSGKSPGTDLSYGPLVKHLLGVGFGILFFVGAIFLTPRALRFVARFLILLAVVLLILVLVPGLGHKEYGSQRWLDLGMVYFQPSELAKLAMGLFLANYLAGFRSVLKDWKKGLVPMGIAHVFVLILLQREPDYGSMLLLGVLAMMMLAVAGTRLRYLAIVSMIGGVFLLVVFVYDPVRSARLVGWLFPHLSYQGAGHHNHFAMRFITAGGLSGAGLGAGPGHSLGYLTQSSSDFIFSVAGEELGFLGIVGIALLFGVLVLQGIRLVRRCREDFQRFAAFGLTLLLVLPAWIHMMVNLGLFPTKGIACPFLSSGGSSMLVSLTIAGMLQRLHLEATAAERARAAWSPQRVSAPEGAE